MGKYLVDVENKEKDAIASLESTDKKEKKTKPVIVDEFGKMEMTNGKFVLVVARCDDTIRS